MKTFFARFLQFIKLTKTSVFKKELRLTDVNTPKCRISWQGLRFLLKKNKSDNEKELYTISSDGS